MQISGKAQAINKDIELYSIIKSCYIAGRIKQNDFIFFHLFLENNNVSG